MKPFSNENLVLSIDLFDTSEERLYLSNKLLRCDPKYLYFLEGKCDQFAL